MSTSIVSLLDARGLLCPLPTVKTSLKLDEISSGQVLEILFDDPTTRRELPHWCAEHGHAVLALSPEGKAFRLSVKKK